ncbi:hypothetical protein B0J11DRAFT_496705 [Dendryphion nanum]|uniref:Uncharacterized protein n=1 Tax=Dendryphion nanum TaxID=256645 RepID=A0A9P9IAL8_9PLEO|nr:hypothetical protein B0J11DRAFT_496705 [Dendryphion nanum]
MKPWLEDLSEEWVAQPAPSVEVPNVPSPSATQSAQSVPPKPRSLLPRMRHSSGSFSEINLRQVAKDLKPPKQRSVLNERSLSDNNIPLSSDTADPTPATDAGSSLGASSSGSVIHNGTMEIGSVVRSPNKDQAEHNTPEWRRRLLQGDVGYKDQKDLFSPMGLENIFQKPNGESSAQPKQRKTKLGLLKDLGAMPSSPPPWPSSVHAGGVNQNEEDPSDALNHSRNDSDAYVSKLQDKDVWKRERSENPSSDPFSPSLSFVPVGPRTVSGQIEFENENFSPVYLTTNLKVGTQAKAIPDFTGSQLAHRLRQIGSPPPTIDVQPASNDNSAHQSQNDSSFSRLHDDSLPADLPAGTPDLADIGKFVEMRRGGYSRDGSFRRRPLSPSPQAKIASRRILPNTSSPEKSSPIKLPPSAPSPPLSPVTPRRQRQSEHLSPERAQTSGSPLKLFDAHDTFTSNRLQRRLSQLEYRSEKTTTNDTKSETTKTVQQSSRLTSVEEVSIHKVAAGVQEDESVDLEKFGQGHLDEYEFPDQISADCSQLSFADDSAPENSPSMDVAPPGSRQPRQFVCDGSPQSRKVSRNKRQGLIRVSNPFRSSSQSNRDQPRNLSSFVARSKGEKSPEQEYAEGKRGPTSPFKDPTPKRRRTLHSVDDSDDSIYAQDLVPVQDSHAAMQSVIGRKRKDARHEQSINVADPDVLARRHILRPRNPTPSQRRRDEIHAEIMEATEAFLLSSPKLNTIRERLDSSINEDVPQQTQRATDIANEVAEFNLHRAQPVRDESRKRSVTTQDFLDEAVKIMDYIRARGRPTSALESLEETDSELPATGDLSEFSPTPLTFSRPASREGRLSEWREPNKRILDPTVINHLRKYQDQDSENFMGSSMPSLRIPTFQNGGAAEGNSIIVEQDNIRITDNLDRHKQTSYGEDGPSSQPRTNGTHPSTGSSLAQTIVTNTSRRSEHVTTIAAERVAHLIPEQIAGMNFDREKGIWVRQKSPSKEHPPGEDICSTHESEEDPFDLIPDLSVNETEELMRNSGSPSRQQAMAETLLEDTEVIPEDTQPRPVTREGRQIPVADTSSIPSKASNFAWSFPKTETRATSWSDQGTRKGSIQKLQQPPATFSIPESDELDVEHEIKYFEGRGTGQSVVQNAQIRDITFSIEEHDFAEQSDHVECSSPQKTSPQKSGSSAIRHNHHTTKPVWRGAQSLPHSRKPMKVQEGELSILEDLPTRNYTMQLSMNVTAPRFGNHEQNGMLAAPSSPSKGDATFMLSDLPEFTLHQVDECELPDRIVVKHDGARFSKALEDRYALGTADLVKALQDVEPDEPYWEDLRDLDLHGKGLVNLYRLDEFCYRVESLDVSDNNISHIKGIPFTVRRLFARNNSLTGLTSWASLMNLQQLDISSNEIDSLDGLGELLHLRVLKIDNNKLQSLDGIMHLDGLMELSASGNQISSIDFARANLKSITDLNLRGNCITEVRNLHCLPQLQHLDLDENSIDHFPHFDIAGSRCKSLRSLRLAHNKMHSLNVDSYCPSIESLHVDGNALVQIDGLDRLRRLRTLSAREQILDEPLESDGNVTNLFRNSDVRNLYISINPSHSLGISQHMMNLQRLELASMGLKELPEDFGLLTPNIRSINLNFNSIKDLRPLLNIKRLTELLVVGNKLGRLRTNLAVLGKLATLTKLDMRDNPLTLRFYAPAVETRIMSLRRQPIEEESTDRFVLPDGDADVDMQYVQRLDFETRLRRRVQEILLCTNCKNLKECDGIPFDRSRILVKDEIWERLLRLGVVKKMEAALESFQSER